jgi:methylated-DNA-[protein]-cysteine S-methyltransferase
MFYSYVESPIGKLLLSGGRDELQGLYFSTGSKARGADEDWERSDEPFRRVKKQLKEYFAGERKVFDLALAPSGTDFQLSVLDALQEIPYGETCSYLDIAQRIGNAKAVRAVGSANGNNPIALIIPCHRVIGSNGSLTGFGGGLETKRFLLDLELSHSGLWA